MVDHVRTFTNQMSYLALHNLIRRLYEYETRRINEGDSLYLYNQTTKVVYIFDHRVYYKKIGYLPDIDIQAKPEKGKRHDTTENYRTCDLPQVDYIRMPGSEKRYSENEILFAFRQGQEFYFANRVNNNINFNEVNKQTRAIALFCEAIRFQTIHKALLNNAMPEDNGIAEISWANSWRILANNWSRITNQEFTIPVSEQTVCHFMQHQATPEERESFKNSINQYLGSTKCQL